MKKEMDTSPRPGLLCPACQVPLVMTERQNIEIDYCPSCRGVWLDRGELDKIIERSAVESPAARPREEAAQDRYRDAARSRGHHGDYGYRRKSWLQDRKSVV